MKESKKDRTQRQHARRSFDARYGVILTDAVHDELVKQILDGAPILAASGKYPIFRVEYNMVAMPVAYNRKNGLLITALPVQCLDPKNIGVKTFEHWDTK